MPDMLITPLNIDMFITSPTKWVYPCIQRQHPALGQTADGIIPCTAKLVKKIYRKMPGTGCGMLNRQNTVTALVYEARSYIF